MGQRNSSIDIVTHERLAEMRNNWPEWRSRCNEWEREFVGDMLDRYRTYGPGIQLSVKQRNMLTEIHDKVKE